MLASPSLSVLDETAKVTVEKAENTIIEKLVEEESSGEARTVDYTGSEKLSYAIELTEEILKMLDVKGWSIGYHNSRKRVGTTNYLWQSISYSRELIPAMPMEAIKDTVLHEIAHALTEGTGHTLSWRETFIALGGSGERYAKGVDPEKASYKWKGTCPAGHTVWRNRLSKGLKEASCGNCSREFSPEHKLTWQELR